MKLPKCPHCKKLMIGMFAGGVTIGDGQVGEYREAIAYFCPEKQDRQEPEWVEVLEV